MKSLILNANASESDQQRAVMVLTAGAMGEQVNALMRARAFAEPLLVGEVLDTSEAIMAHADGVALILRGIGGSEAMQAATYLVYAFNHLNKPMEVITKSFGANYAGFPRRSWIRGEWVQLAERSEPRQAESGPPSSDFASPGQV